ncbi:sulfur oxidation c-type cytochrome SoxX [Alsobacter sp. R-9]
MRLAVALAAALAASLSPVTSVAQAPLLPFAIVDDGIPEPIGGLSGDAARGRAIVVDRQRGLCLLCHTGPFPEQRFQGTLAPSLAGAGSRWSAAQLRLRVADGRRIDPETIMPSYYRVEGLVRVARAFQGKPILDAQQIEDVVAFLATLRDPAAGAAP